MNKILLASLLVATSFAQPINEALPFAGAPRVGANDTVPPPAPVSPTDEQLKTIKAKLAEFRVALAALQAAGVKFWADGEHWAKHFKVQELERPRRIKL